MDLFAHHLTLLQSDWKDTLGDPVTVTQNPVKYFLLLERFHFWTPINQHLTMKLSHLFLSAAILAISSTNPSVLAQEDAASGIECEEICASQVAEATRAANIEKEELEKQLNPLRAALDQAKDASVAAAAEVTTLKGQLASMEEAVAAAKKEATASQLAASAAEAAVSAKLANMKSELDEAEAKAKKFEETKFFINKDLIKAEAMGLLKKYGLVKGEEEEL